MLQNNLDSKTEWGKTIDWSKYRSNLENMESLLHSSKIVIWSLIGLQTSYEEIWPFFLPIKVTDSITVLTRCTPDRGVQLQIWVFVIWYVRIRGVAPWFFLNFLTFLRFFSQLSMHSFVLHYHLHLWTFQKPLFRLWNPRSIYFWS